MDKAPVIALVGETASGKTAAAIKLARALGGEIISADSWAVYRHFNVGTAKPDEAESRQAVFHLIDVVDAEEGFSAAEFKRRAQAAIEDILRRGKVPILAGGTGLYVDSVLYDYSFLPAGDSAVRDTYNHMSLEQLLALTSERKISTEGIDLRNKRRVIRLLESGGERPVRGPLRPNTFYAGLRVDSEALRARVEARTDAMLAAGLEQEVQKLSQTYGWQVEPMKGIGYREWELYFSGVQSLEQTRDRIVSATMQLAKRQRTWFKRNPDIRWFDDPDDIYEQAKSFLEQL